MNEIDQLRLKIDVAQNANLSSRLAARERWTRWVKERNALAPVRVSGLQDDGTSCRFTAEIMLKSLEL